MEHPPTVGDLSVGAKTVLGFIGASFVTCVVLFLTILIRRLIPAASIVDNGVEESRKAKPKPKNGKAHSTTAEEDPVNLHVDATPSVPAGPGISLKQLLKDSKAKGAKAGTGTGTGKANHHALYLNTLKGAGDAVCALAFSRDGKGVATAADDRMLRLYQIEDVAGKGVTFKRKELRKGAAGVAFGASPDEVAVLTKGMVDAAGLAGFRAGSKGAVEGTWEQDNILAGKPALTLRAGLQHNGAAVLLVAGQKTDLVIYSMQGTRLAAVDSGGILTHDAALSGNGRFFAAATFTSDVKVYEVSFDRGGAFSRVAKAMDLKGHKSQVLSVAFSDDATRAVTSSKDGTWAVWNIAVRYGQNEDPKRLLSRTQEVSAAFLYKRLAYGPDGIIAALSGRDIHFLDAQSGSLLEVVEDAHDGEILDISWAPVKFQLAGGRTTAVLGTCGSDNLVRLWRSPKA